MTRTVEPAMPFVVREDGETQIVLGRGAVARLNEFLDRLDRNRAFLVTGRSLAASAAGDAVRKALGHRLVGTYAGSRPHVPTATVEDVVAAARDLRADVLIGFGGGSPLGTAKAAVFQLQENGDRSPAKRIVAGIPTTYAGSEVTASFGTTDVELRRKSVMGNAVVRPRLALYDPELALDTPPELTAGTGMNAIAHCVEGLYSKRATDVDRAMAVQAARLLVEHLPKAVEDPRNVYHRYKMFEGSMQAGLVLAHAGMGVHHGLCHVLGGRYNAPHGVLNAIVLPHAMRFNLPIAREAYRELAPTLGVRATDRADAAEAVCQAMSEFARRLGLPQRLRDLGIPRSDLPLIAEEALQSKAVQLNPRPVRTAGDALEILENAW